MVSDYKGYNRHISTVGGSSMFRHLCPALLFVFCVMVQSHDNKPVELGVINSKQRRWTNHKSLIQDRRVYSRSPFVMYGRGYQTILSGFNRDTPQMWIDIRTWRDGDHHWSAMAVMAPPDAFGAIVNIVNGSHGTYEDVLYDGSLYGYWISGAGTLDTGVIFAVAASEDPIFYPDADTRLNQSGSVYMYRGEYSQWTNTQKLLPDDIRQETFFGDSVSMCPKIPTNLAVGAHGDWHHGLFQAGAAYMFKGSPTGRYWTQVQKLYPADESELDWFGYRVALYDEFLFVSSQYDDDNGVNSGAVYIFRQERAFGLNIWSQQQKMVSPGVSLAYGEFVTVHQHTMVMGSNFEDEFGGSTRTGAVYVYKTYKTLEMPYKPPPSAHDDALTVRDDESSSSPKPKPKPVPMFKWWSQQQKLLARDWHIYRYFGTYTTVYGDGKVLATGAFGEAFSDPIWEFPPLSVTGDNYRSGSAYIFVKDEKYDRWTQQQKFISPAPRKGEYFSDPYLHGTDLIIRNTKEGFLYTDNMNWNCLMLSVADTFGDGWDKGYLIAYAPGSNTKLTDQYAPYCDSRNPLVLRYCPLLMEDEGVHFFKMSDDYRKHRYWGEIRYEIYNEADGKIYYGNHETSIGFHWDTETLSFTHLLSKNDKLVDTTKCEACPKPPPKPKPAALSEDDHPDRQLKQAKSYTSAPSISPAPTLSQTVELDYSVVQMATSSLSGWHGVNNTGTYWEIYNGNAHSRGTAFSKHGTKLLYTGTICDVGATSGRCDLQLPDGDYIFRVGGALDPEQGSHTWQFCGRVGGATEMLAFSIKNRQCTPYSQYTAAQYCSNVVGVALVLEGVIELTGAHTLSSFDYEAVGHAVTHLLSPAHVEKVTATRFSGTDSEGHAGFLVSFQAFVDAKSLGNEEDGELEDAFDTLAVQMLGASDDGSLTLQIIGASEEMTQGDHGLMGIKAATLLSFEFGGETILDSRGSEENHHLVTNMLAKETQQHEVMSPIERLVAVEAVLGYTLLVALALLVAGVAWRLAIRTDRHERVEFPAYEGKAPGAGVLPSSSLLQKNGEVNDMSDAEKMHLLRTMGPALRHMADLEDENLRQYREKMDM